MERMNPVKLENVNCEICGKRETTILFKARDYCHELPGEFNVSRCSNCGLAYLNPRPTKEGMEVYYPEGYAPHKRMGGVGDIRFQQRLLGFFIKFHGGELRTLWRLKPGKILDVGCGGGMYLKALKERGWTVYGVDASAVATQRARALGLNNIFTGELHEARHPDNLFDAILMRHSLEHMPHPSETLAEVHRILRPGGAVLIVAPNFQSTEARLFKQHWYQIDAPRHFYFLEHSTIRNLLHKHNFRITTYSFSSRPFSSFVKSITYGTTSKVIKRLLDNTISYIISHVIFWPWHRDTSMVVLAKK
ncbi:MAG: class I SAM-dependent methyltransferase [candidate division WOR-3 bacterium]|nr:MAG: class I SAM-dependent methyltransferase [candidate division WOR-3 bacterium]